MASTLGSNLSQKRKADSLSPDQENVSPGPSKKKTPIQKKLPPTVDLPTYTPLDLSALSHADLLAHAISLQTQLNHLNTNPSTPPATKTTNSLTTTVITKRVSQLQTLMERQIRKSMVWKPSCKTGSETFS